jgi:hypothetical protein
MPRLGGSASLRLHAPELAAVVREFAGRVGGGDR